MPDAAPAPALAPDRLGVGLSAVCLAHCLLSPVLVALGLVWAGLEGVHLALLVLILPVATWAAWRADAPTRTLLGIGAALLVAALALEPVLGEAGEVALTVAGGVALVTGHLLNLRRTRHQASRLRRR